MRLLRFFRRPRVIITQLVLDPQEARVMSAHNLDPVEWDALTDPERAHYRATYTQAERYAA